MLEDANLAPQSDQLFAFIARQSGTHAGVDLRVAHPVAQRGIRDAKVLGNRGERLLATVDLSESLPL